MQYCVDHPEEVSKLAKVKAQVSEVKGVMMENIEKVWYELTQKDTHICIILEKNCYILNIPPDSVLQF